MAFANAIKSRALFSKAKQPAIGFVLHVSDCYLEELEKVLSSRPAKKGPVKGKVVEALVDPFIALYVDEDVIDSVKKRIMEAVLNPLIEGIISGEEEEENENESIFVPNGPFAGLDCAGISARLFDQGAVPGVRFFSFM